jgi:hypothetical protein
MSHSSLAGAATRLRPLALALCELVLLPPPLLPLLALLVVLVPLLLLLLLLPLLALLLLLLGFTAS